MASFTAKDVAALREKTGVGMMECKKALVETDGDVEKAIEILREKGLASAAKKASRIAAEGICRVALDGNKKAAVVEVNSETDFVAKNETFQTFVEAVAKQALASSAADVEAMMDEQFVDDAAKTVKEALVEKTATIGEKLSIRRFEKVEGDCVVSYIHGGGRIGVLVEAAAECNDANKEALKNIAMQVAAMNPQYIKESDMATEEVAKLREITVDSALNTPETLPAPILKKLIAEAVESVWSPEDVAIYEEQKNNLKYLFNFLSKEAKSQVAELAVKHKAEIVNDKIFNGLVEGRFAKQMKDICLLDQVYVKAEDGKQTVAEYLKSVDKGLEIVKLIRYEVGEGIEKRNENFADEVAKQMGL